MFCFPEAGGSAESFAPFAELADMAQVEVHTISPQRTKAITADRARQYVDQASAYIQRFSDRPYVVFGQSIGALLGWSVVHRLATLQAPLPSLHVASSAFSPESLRQVLLATGESEWLRRIVGDREYSSVQSRAADFVGDLKLWQSLQGTAREQLPVPIVTVLGTSDHLLRPSDVAKWSGHTDHYLSNRLVPGDHFYLRNPAAVRVLLGELAELLRAGLGPR
jgi:surfactin synthase thioesterase subunit